MPLVNLGFEHRFVPARPEGTDYPPLLLLHGTGGDEDDLLPLGEAIAPGAALLSPRGKVLENSMPRFFRRLAEGVFDVKDVEVRAHELADFVLAAREAYSLPQPLAVGFSNGANIAAAVLLLRPEVLAGGILLRPMVPLEPRTVPDLSGARVLIGAARHDPIATPSETERLRGLLEKAGAQVQVEWVNAGHGLTNTDVANARAWLG